MKDLCGDGRTAVKVSSERLRFASHGDTRRLFDESRSTKSALAPVRMGGRDGLPRRRAVHDYRHRDYHLRGVRIHHGDDRGGPRRRWRPGDLQHDDGSGHPLRDWRGPRGSRRMADALRVARDANARGMDALVNHLGEHYREKGPVEATTREYLGLLDAMRSQGIRGTVSLKPTQFGVLIDRAYALSQMLPVLDATKADGRVLWLDMENAHTTDDALWIGERLLERYDRVGVCVQANLKRTAGDLDRLIADRARIRLVKGAYKEPADIAYPNRQEIDRAYLAHLETLFQRTRDFAVGSHDGRMINRALELAREHSTSFEFAMLQGVRDPLKRELVAQGHRVSEDIARAIWHAGLARQKAPRIRAIAQEVRDRWAGRLDEILALPTNRARDELMSLPGVGPKTADVVLAMSGGHPTFPVDTHIARIAGRWRLTRRKDYESIRAALERWTPPEKRKAWHLAIISHGRALCKARNPRCSDCPVRRDCDWYLRHRAPEGRGVAHKRGSSTKVKSASPLSAR